MYQSRSVRSSVCYLAFGPAYFHSIFTQLKSWSWSSCVLCSPWHLSDCSLWASPCWERGEQWGELLWKRGKEDKSMIVLLQALRKMYQDPILNMGTREGERLHGREQTEVLCFHSQTSRSDKRTQWTNIGNTGKIMGPLITYWLQEQENVVPCNYDRQQGHWKLEYPG